MQAFVERFPAPGRTALALTLASVAASNAWLAWQVFSGALSISGVVLLVLVEALLLSLLEAGQRSTVPAAHRSQKHGAVAPASRRWISWTAGPFAIGGAYLFWALVIGEIGTARSFLLGAQAWIDAGLHVALGITAMFALLGLAADRDHYRRAGPPLVSSVELEATTRRFTLVYGALVFAVPVVALCALAYLVMKRLSANRDSPAWNAVFGLAMIGTFFGSTALLVELAGLGPAGWAAVYLFGKALVEGLFALLPVLGERALVKSTAVPA